MLDLTKMDHLNPKIIDTSLKSLKYFVIILLLYIVGCDFRMPQDWETPKWILPVTIPMLGDSLKVIDMIDSESSSIELIEANYSVTENLVMIPAPPEEGSISIDENYFTVPSIGSIFQEGTEPDIEIPSFSTDNIESISNTIPPIILSDILGSEFDNFDCLPADKISEQTIDLDSIDPISIYSPDDFTGICDELVASNPNFTTCEMSVNDIIINNSSFDLTLTNGLPFIISDFQLEFLNQNGETWINSQIQNVQPNAPPVTDSTPLDNSALPTEISATPSITITPQDISTTNCTLYLPLSDYEDQISSAWEEPAACQIFASENLLNQDCDCFFNSTSCYLDINNESECDNLESTYNETNDPADDDINLDYVDNECQVNSGVDGWSFSGNESLEISYSFEMNDGAIDAAIEILYEESGTADVAVEEGIDLISAHLVDTEDLNTNKLYLEYTDNMFGDFSFDIEFGNFYDSEQTLLVIGSNDLDENGMYDFSDHYIGNPNNDNISIIDNIGYSIVASLNESSTIIEMNKEEPYGFSVESANITAFEFDQLKVNLQEFESPPIEMGDMPAGLSGMELPTLAFDLIFFNEINCPLTLNLDIIGVNEFETTTIHVEPNLTYSNVAGPIDKSTIRILENSLDVIQIESIDGTDTTYTTTSYDYGLNADGEQITIYDVFSADNIQVEGYASLSGICELEPGASVWADLELNIDPLTIILTDDITFISETPSEIEPITASEENSTIHSAVLKLDIENHIPVDGRFDFLISNSSQFPPCLDSLVSDLSLDEQVANLIISQTCVDYINEYYNLSNIAVECENPEQDCTNDYNFYYIEFERFNNEPIFFGKLADMSLLLPTEIDDAGYVQTASSYSDSLNLLGDKLDWLSKDNILYVTPQVILTKSDDNGNGYRTLRSTDYMSFESLLRIEIDMGEVIE